MLMHLYSHLIVLALMSLIYPRATLICNVGTSSLRFTTFSPVPVEGRYLLADYSYFHMNSILLGGFQRDVRTIP